MNDDHRDNLSRPEVPLDSVRNLDLAPDPLLAEFTPLPDRRAWLKEVDRLLNGDSFARSLTSTTPEGITLQPLYTNDQPAAATACQSQPGSPPYLRGRWAAGYRHRPWQIAQELPYPDPQEFNTALRHDLERGQTAVNLVLDAAGQLGYELDASAPARSGPERIAQGGTAIASVQDLEEALAGVDLAVMPIHLQSGLAAVPVAALLMAHCRAQGIPLVQLRGSFGCDPVAELIGQGCQRWSLDCIYDQLAGLTQWACSAAPGIHTILAQDTPYIEGGGSAVHSLAFTLAAAATHLRELMQHGLSCEDIAPRIQFGFAVGTRFFMEIARLRAARTLWSHLVAASGGSPRAQQMAMHVRSCERSRTCFDPHVNLLRGTTEALAAVLGGCDSLHISPFDCQLGLPDEFSRRLARNTQLILRHECHLDRVVDPAGGAWYVEHLSLELAKRAWSLFQQIEAAGGMITAVKQGLPQQMVTEAARNRQEAVNRRQEVLVGTNLFPNAAENLPDAAALTARYSDLSALRSRRQQRYRDLHENPDPSERARVEADLQRTQAESGANRFEAAVSAAAHGATLSDLSRVLGLNSGPPTRVTPLPRSRDAVGFESLRRAVLSWRAHNGSDPQVYLASVGNPAEAMARQDFARAFCEVGGLAVAGDSWFPHAAAAARATADSAAPIVIIVTTDERLTEVVPDLTADLKNRPSAPVVVMAGNPGENEQAFRSAGVDLFIHRRSDAQAILRDLAGRLGVTL